MEDPHIQDLSDQLLQASLKWEEDQRPIRIAARKQAEEINRQNQLYQFREFCSAMGVSVDETDAAMLLKTVPLQVRVCMEQYGKDPSWYMQGEVL